MKIILLVYSSTVLFGDLEIVDTLPESLDLRLNIFDFLLGFSYREFSFPSLSLLIIA